MKPLLIKFGDNDFGNTFIPLLRSIKDASVSDLSKDQIIWMLNMSSLAFYIMHQERGPIDESKLEHVRRYLQLKPSMVYYGDEVDAFFKDPVKLGQCNGDCYYIYPGQEDIGIL